MKRKYLKLSALAIALLGIYLYLSHAYIYHRIKAAGLKAFDVQHAYVIGGIDASVKSPTYAALGDSLTTGVGAEKFEEAYPYLLAQELVGSGNMVLRNFSYPGARTDDLINNLLSPAIAEQPDIITLLIGTNDMHGNASRAKFKKNYQHILERLTKETSAKIYLISIPFIGSETLLLPPYNYYFDRETVALNQVIKDLAATYRLDYIDLATPTRSILKHDGPHYAADSFHPSASGYKLWAKIIYDNINQ